MALDRPQGHSRAMSIRIAVVEDHAETRHQIAKQIEAAPHLRCIGVFASGEECLRQLPSIGCDIALVDLNLPGLSGVDVIRRLKHQIPAIKCLVLTVVNNSRKIFEALSAGADGYLLKRDGGKSLVTRIQEIWDGEAPFSPAIARLVLASFSQPPSDDLKKLAELTPKEEEVLQALCEKGFTNSELAGLLKTKVNTVKSHLSHIYQKLHVNGRAQAAALAHRNGWRPRASGS